MGNFKFVNLWQSKEERQGKYWLARTCGATSYLAMRMKDWRLAKIERHFRLDETYEPTTHKYTRELNTTRPVSPKHSLEPGTG